MSASVDLRDLVHSTSQKTDYTEEAVREIIDAFLDSVTEGLQSKGRVSIRRFGILEVEFRPGGPRRTGLPKFRRAGGVVNVPPKYVPVFKPSARLKDEIQEAHSAEVEAGL